MIDIDKVAEAIWKADRGSDFFFNKKWDHVSDHIHDSYRRMAQAAIDSLELTEEWAVRTVGSGRIGARGVSEASAKAKAHRWPESFEAVSHLVSPWVRSEDQ